jgi:hypothetical protein
MKFGKVRLYPEAMTGMTKTEFKKQFMGSDFRPYSIDEVWDEIKSKIPKKSK